MTFKLEFNFPSNYPYGPPDVKFTTPMFHPNVDMAGRICLDILKVSFTFYKSPKINTQKKPTEKQQAKIALTNPFIYF